MSVFRKLDLERVDGSGVLGTKSPSSLVSEKSPGQELNEPEDECSVGQESYICSYRIREAGMEWNCKTAAMEVEERGGTQNAITFNTKT